MVGSGSTIIARIMTMSIGAAICRSAGRAISVACASAIYAIRAANRRGAEDAKSSREDAGTVY